MEQIPYINYKELDEFHTVQQLAALLGISKQELKEKYKQYDIRPRRNEIGDYGFVRFDVRKLHNALYHESRGGTKNETVAPTGRTTHGHERAADGQGSRRMAEDQPGAGAEDDPER